MNKRAWELCAGIAAVLVLLLGLRLLGQWEYRRALTRQLGQQLSAETASVPEMRITYLKERSLVLHGADPLRAVGTRGVMILHHACACGDTPMVETLLARGAKVNAGTSSWCTPLLYACYGGQTDVVRALLERGADPNVESMVGITPLDFADRIPRIRSLLHAHGAIDRPNQQHVHIYRFEE